MASVFLYSFGYSNEKSLDNLHDVEMRRVGAQKGGKKEEEGKGLS